MSAPFLPLETSGTIVSEGKSHRHHHKKHRKKDEKRLSASLDADVLRQAADQLGAGEGVVPSVGSHARKSPKKKKKHTKSKSGRGNSLISTHPASLLSLVGSSNKGFGYARAYMNYYDGAQSQSARPPTSADNVTLSQARPARGQVVGSSAGNPPVVTFTAPLTPKKNAERDRGHSAQSNFVGDNTHGASTTTGTGTTTTTTARSSNTSTGSHTPEAPTSSGNARKARTLDNMSLQDIEKYTAYLQKYRKYLDSVAEQQRANQNAVTASAAPSPSAAVAATPSRNSGLLSVPGTTSGGESVRIGRRKSVNIARTAGDDKTLRQEYAQYVRAQRQIIAQQKAKLEERELRVRQQQQLLLHAQLRKHPRVSAGGSPLRTAVAVPNDLDHAVPASDYQAMAAQLNTFMEKLSKQNVQYAQLQVTSQQHERNASQLAQKASAQTSKIRQLQDEIRELKHNHNSALSRVELDLRNTQSQLQESQQRYRALVMSKGVLERASEQQKAESLRRLAQLRADVHHSEVVTQKEIQNITADRDNQRSQAEKMRAQNLLLNDQLASLRETHALLTVEYDKVLSENRSMAQRLSHLSNSVEVVQDKAMQAGTHIHQQRDAIVALETDLQDVKVQLANAEKTRQSALAELSATKSAHQREQAKRTAALGEARANLKDTKSALETLQAQHKQAQSAFNTEKAQLVQLIGSNRKTHTAREQQLTTQLEARGSALLELQGKLQALVTRHQQVTGNLAAVSRYLLVRERCIDGARGLLAHLSPWLGIEVVNKPLPFKFPLKSLYVDACQHSGHKIGCVSVKHVMAESPGRRGSLRAGDILVGVSVPDTPNNRTCASVAEESGIRLPFNIPILTDKFQFSSLVHRYRTGSPQREHLHTQQAPVFLTAGMLLLLDVIRPLNSDRDDRRRVSGSSRGLYQSGYVQKTLACQLGCSIVDAVWVSQLARIVGGDVRSGDEKVVLEVKSFLEGSKMGQVQGLRVPAESKTHVGSPRQHIVSAPHTPTAPQQAGVGTSSGPPASSTAQWLDSIVPAEHVAMIRMFNKADELGEGSNVTQGNVGSDVLTGDSGIAGGVGGSTGGDSQEIVSARGTREAEETHQGVPATSAEPTHAPGLSELVTNTDDVMDHPHTDLSSVGGPPKFFAFS